MLAAASVACVVTSAAAAPFEVLRVKSMGLVESSGWKEVLRQFIVEKPDVIDWVEDGEAFVIKVTTVSMRTCVHIAFFLP